jgi:hypothetical protein
MIPPLATTVNKSFSGIKVDITVRMKRLIFVLTVVVKESSHIHNKTQVMLNQAMLNNLQDMVPHREASHKVNLASHKVNHKWATDNQATDSQVMDNNLQGMANNQVTAIHSEIS